jgi:hypothetical protein
MKWVLLAQKNSRLAEAATAGTRGECQKISAANILSGLLLILVLLKQNWRTTGIR